MNNNEIAIYALKDPVSGRVRYMGSTAFPKQRQYSHVSNSEAKNPAKTEWVNGLKAAGFEPRFEVLRWSSIEDRYNEEKRAISDLQPDLNMTIPKGKGRPLCGRKNQVRIASKYDKPIRIMAAERGISVPQFINDLLDEVLSKP